MNVTDGTNLWRNYEIFLGDCDPSVGTELFCHNTVNSADSFFYHPDAGDVFYMKAIAEVGTNDFSSAEFLVTVFEGDDCTSPADVLSSNHYLDTLGEDCWWWVADNLNTIADHSFTCDPVTGGDMVIEYTTGSSQTQLNFDASISNYSTSSGNGYLAIEITGTPCDPAGTSEYCHSIYGDLAYGGSIAVAPGTTYYIWVGDGFNGHYLPDINICLW